MKGLKNGTAAAMAAALVVWLSGAEALAKRDFFVQSEVRCEDNPHICYDAASGAPFTGELRLYYPNGTVRAKIFYANGVRHGKYRVYFQSGELRYSASYRDGLSEGVLTTYYDNGKIREETHSENGERHGERRLYYRDGRLKREENYNRGRLDGTMNSYYPNGNPAVRVLYREGVAVSGYCLAPKGQRLDFSADIAKYQQSGQTPCDEMIKQAAEEAVFD